MNLKDLPLEEYYTSGHTACPGCAGAIVARIAMKIFGKNTVTAYPACCLLVFGGTYPLNAFKVPYLHLLFENTAVVASGIKSALRKMGREDTLVVGFAGDGGTADIGMQALSGAAERNDDIIYICYDNEAYMNTGVQRSGATPYGAITTTTPEGTVIQGKLEFKKDMPKIMIAHNVPYVATACPSYPIDLINKFEKAKKILGFRYLHIFAPCPTGWRFPPEKTIEMGRLAVETGMFTIYECESGKYKINIKPKFTDVRKYLNLQGRFKGMSEEKIKILEGWIKEKWQHLQ